MESQVTKDTKFKDLPDSIKYRLICMAKMHKPLSAPHSHSVNDFRSVRSKISGLCLNEMKSTFDQCITNCEAYRENVEVSLEDVNRNVEKELSNLKSKILLFKESQDDTDLLENMHETIRSLYMRFEKLV